MDICLYTSNYITSPCRVYMSNESYREVGTERGPWTISFITQLGSMSLRTRLSSLHRPKVMTVWLIQADSKPCLRISREGVFCVHAMYSMLHREQGSTRCTRSENTVRLLTPPEKSYLHLCLMCGYTPLFRRKPAVQRAQ